MPVRKQTNESRQSVPQSNSRNPLAQAAAATRTTVAAPRLSRGPVDAPGKRHRTPVPDERLDRRLGETRGKHMGQKSLKNTPRG